MRQIDDAPDIRQTLKTGYPSDTPQRVCPKCGEDIGDYIYTTDDGDMCGECFAEYMKDSLRTNPQLFADAFGIACRYTG